jgi:hypothetical protein
MALVARARRVEEGVLANEAGIFHLAVRVRVCGAQFSSSAHWIDRRIPGEFVKLEHR